jgi:hypothetical protein
MNTETRDPDPSTVSAVRSWGRTWTCSFDERGRLMAVRLNGGWFEARWALREHVCWALELAYERMPA